MTKKRKAPSELQKVCMQYGRDVYRIQNTTQLIHYLEEQGFSDAAVAIARHKFVAEHTAKKNYFRERKKLQPEWRDWDQRILDYAEQEQVEWGAHVGFSDEELKQSRYNAGASKTGEQLPWNRKGGRN